MMITSLSPGRTWKILVRPSCFSYASQTLMHGEKKHLLASVSPCMHLMLVGFYFNAPRAEEITVLKALQVTPQTIYQSELLHPHEG